MDQASVDNAMKRGLEHHQAGRLAEAEAIYRQVLGRHPNHPPALHLLGVVAGSAGRPDVAVELIRRAIAILPGNFQFHHNLGKHLADMRRLEEAVGAYQEALRLKPGAVETMDNMAIAQLAMGRVDDSIATYREAIRLKPQWHRCHAYLAIALREKGLLEEAMASADEAVRLMPSDAMVHANRGMVLGAKGEVDEAIASFQKALELRPAFWEAQNNLGNAYKDAGRMAQAIATYRVLLEMNPRLVHVHSTLLYGLHMVEGIDAAELLREHKAWAEKYAAPLKKVWTPHSNGRDAERRLKVGYVSGDFREHAVGRFIRPLLAAHDPNEVEVFCYSAEVTEDGMTARLKEAAEHWRLISSMNDEAAARQIREDGIDVLVDLSMHTAGARLGVFARKPAPVQVTYLAYCSTTGMEAMDYRITDGYLDPPGTEGDYVEKTMRVASYWCYEPAEEMPEVGALPAAGAGGVTFGSLNNFCKVSEGAIGAWCRILGSVAGSRLILHAPQGGHRRRVLEAAARMGVEAGRIEFVGYMPRAEYFATYGRIDIGLDAFPYGGGTTTCDALWMGVPVVTVAGRTGVGRGGVSILNQLGLGEWVARDVEEYVRKAAALAGNLGRLVELRRGMRQRMKGSPLMDAGKLAREMEGAYRGMWREWCAR